MIEEKQLREAENRVKDYLATGRLLAKHKEIAKYIRFFIKNAEKSIMTAKALFELSEEPQKKKALALDESFESYLWVIVSAYYSMFYAALALMASKNMKVGEQSPHKVVADVLVVYFLKNKTLVKLIAQYHDVKQDAMELIGIEERAVNLVESFDRERVKRHKFQYELGTEAQRNKAITSLERATTFVAEVRNILREEIKSNTLY
jgi:uncharacterized protein (UPF0332 family)